MFFDSELQQLLEDEGQVENALSHVALFPENQFLGDSCESEPEHRVRDALVKHITSEKLSWSLIPQVNLASITGNEKDHSEQRVDFLLTHPIKDPLVIEVDGPEHYKPDQVAIDSERDERCKAAGACVLRIDVEDIPDNSPSFLGTEDKADSSANPELVIGLRWIKLVHQLQLSLLQAIRGGWLSLDARWNIHVRLPDGLRSHSLSETLLQEAVANLRELLQRLSGIRGQRLDIPEPEISVDEGHMEKPQRVVFSFENGCVDTSTTNSVPTFAISDFPFPHNFMFQNEQNSVVDATDPSEKDCEWMLNYIFRKPAFRSDQWPAIKRILEGHETLVLLPTGAGKSIAFQLAALLRGGPCIVVDPLIALMNDQVENLRTYGIDRCQAITSGMGSAAARKAAYSEVATGQHLFTFVAPERFQLKGFREALRHLTDRSPIALIAADEAHCVTEWGHDFRTAYLNIARTAREFCSWNDQTPPVVGLTGTASRLVLRDVQRELRIENADAVITPKTYDRKELDFGMAPCLSKDKKQTVTRILCRIAEIFELNPDEMFGINEDVTHAGLIFCPHISGRYGLVKMKEHLIAQLGANAEIYGSGLPKEWYPYKTNEDEAAWAQYKEETLRKFKQNELPLLVTTTAFGMGIDIPHIRYTVHTQVPPSIEAFYQEAGRAGRTREYSFCVLMFSTEELGSPDNVLDVLDPSTNIEEIRDYIDQQKSWERNDISRLMYFHTQAFKGTSAELAHLKCVLNAIGNLEKQREVPLTCNKIEWPPDTKSSDRQDMLEKAIYRLVTIGVISDYTIHHMGEKEVVITAYLSGAKADEIAEHVTQYIHNYHPSLGEEKRKTISGFPSSNLHKYILRVADELISFVYKRIERSRRRSLRAMVRAAELGVSDRPRFRDEMHNYLHETEWDDDVEEIWRSPDEEGWDKGSKLLERIQDPQGVTELFYSAKRQLDSNPDSVALMLLHASVGVLTTDPEESDVQNDLGHFLETLNGVGSTKREDGIRAIARTIVILGGMGGNWPHAAKFFEEMYCEQVKERSLKIDMVRDLRRELPPHLAEPLKEWLLCRLMNRTDAFLGVVEASNDG